MSVDMHWSLDALYPSFQSIEWERDYGNFLNQLDALKKWVKSHLSSTNKPIETIHAYLAKLNPLYDLYSKLSSFARLTLSVEAKNELALQMTGKLDEKIAELVGPSVQFQRWLDSLEHKEELLKEEQLQEHRFHLSELINQTRYLLTDEEETVIARMKNTGSGAWSKLQELLTSTLLVDISIDGEHKQLPLSVVRNMAYDADSSTRRTAYYAELAAYPKIDDSSAASLNAIKGEVLMLAKRRGYASVLEKTLLDSRLNLEVLEAMLTAMKESLPAFRRFYRHKAKLIGHEKGLPFYDLFAPIGSVEMKFTYKQAEEFIVKHFSSFSDRLGEYAKHAFADRWIDAEPRVGKRGGAFCSNLHSIKQSRILTNFTGSFSNVTTLAHELGHGYHGACLANETYLNSRYPMPLAETASIFCETIIKKAAMKNADDKERAVILENEISDSAQVIVDIYSRFLFESEVFKRREEGALSVKELNQIMLDSQIEAYGDGLDPDFLHPSMWVCKPHYYYADVNFYNYPYAFGLLFAKGLYAQYQQVGDSFIKSYDELLTATGKNSAVEVALVAGSDITSVDFWRKSLKLIEEDIDAFIKMT